MSALAEFQRAFAAGLLTPQSDMREQLGAGFAVYQNTVMKGLVDVLRANYPSVERLVGSEWFESAALLYVRQNLPTEPMLAGYGASFPALLQTLEAIQTLPYLPGVAQLDRWWTEAHFAADAQPLRAASLQLSAEALSNLQLRLHPATRFAWLPHCAVGIWQQARPPATPPDALEVEDVEQGVLITRPLGEIGIAPLTRAEFEFLQHIHNALPLGAAAANTLAQHADSDIAAALAKLIAAGAFRETLIYQREDISTSLDDRKSSLFSGR